MKSLIVAAAAALLAISASCSSSGRKTPDRDSDTTSIPIQSPMQDSIQDSMPTLTPEGLIYPLPADTVNNIHIGMALDSLSSSVPGLYNRMVRDASEDAEIISCFSGTEKIFEIYSFDSGIVDMISLTSPVIKAVGSLRIGMPVAEMLRLSSRVSTEWASLDDIGQWYWHVNGLWILPDMGNLPDNIRASINDRRVPPSLSALPEDTKISYIATGLPF